MKYLLCILLIVPGCYADNKNPVRCSECGGDGKVYYVEDHPITKMGFKAGEYQCPMCRGSGILLEE